MRDDKRYVRKESLHKKDGMVMDFDILKKIVKPEIIDKYDHSLVLNGNTSHSKIDLTTFEKVFLLPYQPTSENLGLDFAQQIQNKLHTGIQPYKLILSEAATSFAECSIEYN